MTDYSETLLKIESTLRKYHNLMLKSKWDEATQAMRDVRTMTDWLVEWTKERHDYHK